MLDPTMARERQKRLLGKMAELKLDAVLVGTPHHVYYLSAFKQFWIHEAAFILFSDGKSALVAAVRSPIAGADQLIELRGGDNPMLRLEHPFVVAELAVEALAARGVRTLGVDSSTVSSQVLLRFGGIPSSIDGILHQMRRAKDADELALIRKAFLCVDAMYRRAKEIIEPGIDEIRVFTELNAAAVVEAGEPLTALLGNDYSCGAGGGPPKGGKKAKAGEIYILDVGPAYRGYFSDASRGFAVGGKPTDAQFKAHAALAACFPMIESTAKPGVRCGDLYDMIDEHLKAVGDKGMSHHLGHGVGLHPHERPYVNWKSDEVLGEGEIFTAEPGLYGPQLAGGIRLENVYRVTRSGVENLVNSPLGL